MVHKLIQRGLPYHFAFNSVYAMQPMYTSKPYKKTLTKLKTIDPFSLEPPATPKSKAAIDGLHAFESKHEGYHDQHHSESKLIYLTYLTDKATSFVKSDSFCLAKSYYRIDMVRE